MQVGRGILFREGTAQLVGWLVEKCTILKFQDEIILHVCYVNASEEVTLSFLCNVGV